MSAIKRKPRPSIGAYIASGSGAAFGLCLASWILLKDMDRVPPSENRFLPLVLLDLVITLVLLYASVVVHELGHLLAGKLAGFDLISFCVKPILVTKKGPKWRLTTLRKVRVGGFVSMTPKGDRDLNKRFAVFLGGGVAANLLAGILGLVLYLAKSDGQSGFIQVDLPLWIAISFWFGLSNLLPYSHFGRFTDGKHILNLKTNPTATRRFIAVTMALGELYAGKSAREWERRWMEDMKEPPDGSRVEMSALLFRMSFAKAQGDAGAASEIDTRMREILNDPSFVVDSTSQGFVLSCALFAVCDRNEIKEAERLFELVEPPCLPTVKPYRSLVGAAIACRTGRRDESFRLADEAEKELTVIRRDYGFNLDSEFALIAEIRKGSSALVAG